MQAFTHQALFLSQSIVLLLLASKVAIAQIIPDNTLPVNSTVTPQDNIRVIEAGTRQGDNLFHSFKEFSFSALTADTTGDTAFFNNDLAVKNIFTRVTGGLPSNIDGKIQANGAANLFFINPSGIIFGANASLQIGGSFIASTANRIEFADGTQFSADGTQTSNLLTVSVPIGLGFGSNTGDIINRSQASLDEAVNLFGLPAGLQVQSGNTLALIGGNVFLEGGNLTADGNIEIGSVTGIGLVNLKPTTTGYTFDYSGINNFGNIQFSQGAIVDASGEFSGSIQIQGRNIAITEAAQIFSITLGSESGGNIIVNATESVNLNGDESSLFTDTLTSGNGGNITITTKSLSLVDGGVIATLTDGEGKAGDLLVKAADSIELVGTTSDGLAPTGIASQVCLLATDCQTVSGNGGNLNLETRQLTVRDGARIDASTFAIGDGGDILVKASESIEILGTSLDALITSGIFTQASSLNLSNTGNAGNLTLETQRLTALDGGQISTATFTNGKAGNLTVNASESIRLSGTSPTADLIVGSSGIFASAERGSTGDAGELNINTGLLSVENGARISADNFGTGKGGNLNLNLAQLIVQSGGTIRAGSFGEGAGGNLTVNSSDSVQVIGAGEINTIPITSSLFTQAEGAGNAGDLTINTSNLNVRDGAEVTVSAIGTGGAGNMKITAQNLLLQNQGKLLAETLAGDRGNIDITANSLQMRSGSRITTSAQGSATGGNININSQIFIALEDSDILATAIAGNGGNIKIAAPVFLADIFANGGSGVISGNTDVTKFFGNNRVDISASSQAGTPGFVAVPNFSFLENSLAALSGNLISTERIVASSCIARRNVEQGSFVVTGTGGLPVAPYSHPDVWYSTTEVQAAPSNNVLQQQSTLNQPKTKTVVASQPTWKQGKPIVEAQGITRTADGRTLLAATSQQIATIDPATLICD